MHRLPSRGPYSPFSAGVRTLLARTCIACGELADGDSFPVINSTYRRKTCHHCTNARKKRDRIVRGIGVPAPRPPESLQISRKTRWSKSDDDYLREHIGDMSYENIAIVLGRSLRSVYKRREVLGLAAVRTKHRVEKPWQIRQP